VFSWQSAVCQGRFGAPDPCNTVAGQAQLVTVVRASEPRPERRSPPALVFTDPTNQIRVRVFWLTHLWNTTPHGHSTVSR
jgi:hypothetical protein